MMLKDSRFGSVVITLRVMQLAERDDYIANNSTENETTKVGDKPLPKPKVIKVSRDPVSETPDPRK